MSVLECLLSYFLWIRLGLLGNSYGPCWIHLHQDLGSADHMLSGGAKALLVIEHEWSITIRIFDLLTINGVGLELMRQCTCKLFSVHLGAPIIAIEHQGVSSIQTVFGGDIVLRNVLFLSTLAH